MSLGDVAARLGLPVFPCNQDKRPVTEHGFKDAQTDPEIIKVEFARPGATTIGVPTGHASGLVVIDIDVKDPSANGYDWLDEHNYDLPPTRTNKTQSGGLHLLFKAPPGVLIKNSQGRHNGIAPGVDVRGDGGYVIFPPSPGYSVADDIEPADMPDWLIKACQRRPEPPKPAQRDYRAPANGNANRYAEVALRSECTALANMPEGTRNGALNIAAVKLGSLVAAGALGEHIVINELTHAAAYAGLEPTEIEATLRSGLTYGKTQPREIPEREAQRPPPIPPHEDTPIDDFATPFMPEDLDNIPPRQWVYGHFLIRDFVSVLGAPGGTGKSAYAMTVALSVALGVPLLGETVHERGRAWIYNLEDPKVELRRRLAAAVKHHKIDRKLLKDWLFYNSGRDRPLVIARVVGGSIVTEPVVEEMIAELKRKQIALLEVDPFVRSHELEENRNDHINYAAALWAYVAAMANCTILLVHHFRKGGQSGEADSFRGASALIDASRAALSVARMTEEEAAKTGIDLRERRSYLRVDDAKLNLAPAPEETIWLKLCNVLLPNGDKVQAVERWDMPSPWEDLPWGMITSILEKIGEGPEDGERYTDRKQAKDRWAGQVLIELAGKTERQALAIIKSWIDNGVLEEEEYTSKRMKRKATGLRVNQIKLSEMRLRVIKDADYE
jgi:hypothetical protein